MRVSAPRSCASNVVALVVMPRETFSAEVRKQIQDALGRILDGKLVYYYLAMGEGYTARLHFCFDAAPPSAAQLRAIETEVSQLARTWHDRLREELIERFGERRDRRSRSDGPAPSACITRPASTVARAAGDIERIESLLEGGQNFIVELARQGGGDGAAAPASELRMFELGESLRLSDLMPMLSNFGINVISEEADELRIDSDGTAVRAFVQSFRVQDAHGAALESISGAAMLADALTAVRSGQTEDDPLNALVLDAGLGWREVALLRTYVAAAFQMRLAPALPALRRVLLVNPKLARMLFEMFRLRMDPAGAGSGDARYAGLRTAYLEALGAIDNIVDDRIARALLSMVEATVRTNYFCATPRPTPYITLKFESARIPSLPDTRAALRNSRQQPARWKDAICAHGRIARGGIRFSDRPDDYRTEILDLMKTQTVKNAIIVPAGAKGGFIVKPRPGRAADPRRRGRGLQDADQRDARSDRQPHRRPARCIRRASGCSTTTARIWWSRPTRAPRVSPTSPTQIAIERDFWLGDAFASGGEHGYDHKQLGDHGARRVGVGAPASARDGPRPRSRRADHDDRHRRHVGRRVRQRAAALAQLEAHRRLRPSPHLHRSRPRSRDQLRRAQAAVRSAALEWADYNPALISPGGGVFRRGAEANRAEPASARRARLRRPTRSTATVLDPAHPARAGRPCFTTAASAPTFARATRPTPKSPTTPTTPAASRARACAPRSWSRAATWASPSRRASSTRSPADASTPTRSTTRPASICRITKSI